mgnify:CR=1 FL=1
MIRKSDDKHYYKKVFQFPRGLTGKGVVLEQASETDFQFPRGLTDKQQRQLSEVLSAHAFNSLED